MNRHKKLITILLIVFTFCTTVAIQTYLYVGSAQETLYWGSSGEKVKTVQNKLKQWGYYNGPIDSVYGGGTFEAVKAFQRKNGLAVDGVVGNETAKKLGLPIKDTTASTDYKPSNSSASRDDEINVLARAITGEARGEPYIGQVAVGAVVLNRTRHPSFPNTIAGVIYQPGAFTAVSDGQINAPVEESCIKAARDALNGWDPTGGCLYYWNPATATSKWIWSRTVEKKIGKHWFGN
ncbi:spore cortex-lytic enzyme [Anaerophilus nitritogenes]|uniref:spore cortex-lytic enzyme n=1 Tax=Anaerophilus nitritogenes TaxID=2498136 RepID=UPI00101BEFD5|nr:spore cortex-lytic enzyme [Anaerophilus nitritogenes]